MWKITGYKHPGGGMSWTDQRKINKWNLFFHRFDTATPDHCFSPPTPSACNHLGRGHVLWVVQPDKFSGLSLKLNWLRMEILWKKEQSRVFLRRLKTLGACCMTTQHQNTVVSTVCVWGSKVEDECNELETKALLRQVQRGGWNRSQFWSVSHVPSLW